MKHQWDLEKPIEQIDEDFIINEIEDDGLQGEFIRYLVDRIKKLEKEK